MFRDEKEYKEYLDRQKVDISNLDEENYFRRTENGEIIIDKQDFQFSALDVERYTNCIKWILLKDQKTMALLKRPFGDVYRNLDKRQYNISLYNNILLPQIAKQFQNKSAMYYFVKGNKVSNNMKHILTLDFKRKNEELIYGEDILEKTGGDINELNVEKLVDSIEAYLTKKGFKHQDIEIIKKDFVKQSIFNRFVKQSDENNHNWGLLINGKEETARIAPIYDLDCCCGIGTLKKHRRATNDGNTTNMEGFFKDCGTHKWFNIYIGEVLKDFDINKAIENSKKETGIEIPEDIKDYYKTFFGERFYELKGAYQNSLDGKINENEKNQVR